MNADEIFSLYLVKKYNYKSGSSFTMGIDSHRSYTTFRLFDEYKIVDEFDSNDNATKDIIFNELKTRFISKEEQLELLLINSYLIVKLKPYGNVI